MQGLPAFARTSVPPRFARLRCAQPADRLRRNVLNLEFARVKFSALEQILLPLVVNRIEQQSFLNLARAKLLAQRRALSALRAQPELWLRLNRTRPGR